jgi:site-specific DNA-methyltransferase (adenine-specific)
MTHDIIEVKISDIQVGERVRHDLGDIQDLARSIEALGLLQPIGLTPDNNLVFGERRLRAVRDILKRETIPARIIHVEALLDGQIAENIIRKDFTVSERVAIVKALRGFSHGGDRRSNQVRSCDNETLTLDVAAKQVGFSKDSFYRAEEVINKGIPELVTALDSGQLSINAAHTLAQASPDEQQKCLGKQLEHGRAAARAIEKTLRKIRTEKDRKESSARAIAIPSRHEDVQIHHCPFQELEQTAGIAPESVRLICTDIPYGKDFVEEVEELAAFAERVLVTGGTFVTYCGQYWLTEVMDRLRTHLHYRWQMASVWDGEGCVVNPLNLISKWKPILVFSKGAWKQTGRWPDVLRVQSKEKDWHPWQQPLEEVSKLVSYFSNPGDLVIDPCGGGFTTAVACVRNHRRFIGCDIDKAAAAKGQQRLDLERQPPATLPKPSIQINSITQGDCRTLIPSLPDKSISLALCSPPYAEQRNGSYPGIPEDNFPRFTIDWMRKLWDKLTDNGSVMIIIDPHVKNGVVADYALRTRLALREFGWKEHMSQIWFKYDRCPLGHRTWPRHVYEQVLWFSKSPVPFCDAWANGTPSKRIGSPQYKYSDWSRGQNPQQDGIARTTDVIAVPAGATEKGFDHPAMCPIPLAEALIKTFCPKGGTVLDPFAGSGTTLLAAQRLGCPFYGFDVVKEYVEIARKRLADKTGGQLAG